MDVDARPNIAVTVGARSTTIAGNEMATLFWLRLEKFVRENLILRDTKVAGINAKKTIQDIKCVADWLAGSMHSKDVLQSAVLRSRRMTRCWFPRTSGALFVRVTRLAPRDLLDQDRSRSLMDIRSRLSLMTDMLGTSIIITLREKFADCCATGAMFHLVSLKMT